MKIYLSGQISNIPIEEARKLFEEAKNYLKEKEDLLKNYFKCEELIIINPLDYNQDKTDWSWWDYMSSCIKMMEDVNVICMLSNWKNSDGAKIEHFIAQIKNIKIIYLEEL
jgi:hypothetical protein